MLGPNTQFISAFQFVDQTLELWLGDSDSKSNQWFNNTLRSGIQIQLNFNYDKT